MHKNAKTKISNSPLKIVTPEQIIVQSSHPIHVLLAQKMNATLWHMHNVGYLKFGVMKNRTNKLNSPKEGWASPLPMALGHQ